MAGVCLLCSIKIKQFIGKKRVKILSPAFYAGILTRNWEYEALFIVMFLKGGETAVLGSKQAVERLSES